MGGGAFPHPRFATWTPLHHREKSRRTPREFHLASLAGPTAGEPFVTVVCHV